MNSSYSLNNLRDITIPEPPPLWPPAPGTVLILTFLFLASGYALFRIYRHWKKNAYRRAGLLLLQDAVTQHDLSVTLKRVALAAFDREQVAPLYGEAWIGFLNTSCSRCIFPGSFNSEPDQKAGREELDLAGSWIRHHRIIKKSDAETGP